MFKYEAASNLALDFDLDVVLEQFLLLDMARSKMPASKRAKTRSKRAERGEGLILVPTNPG